MGQGESGGRRMRHMRKALGVTLVCLFALPASSALAGEFKATRNPNPCSVAEPCPTTGHGIGAPDPERPEFTQEFQFGAFNVLCKIGKPFSTTAAEGAPTWTNSESFKTQIKFGTCLTVA